MEIPKSLPSFEGALDALLKKTGSPATKQNLRQRTQKTCIRENLAEGRFLSSYNNLTLASGKDREIWFEGYCFRR